MRQTMASVHRFCTRTKIPARPGPVVHGSACGRRTFFAGAGEHAGFLPEAFRKLSELGRALFKEPVPVHVQSSDIERLYTHRPEMRKQIRPRVPGARSNDRTSTFNEPADGRSRSDSREAAAPSPARRSESKTVVNAVRAAEDRHHLTRRTTYPIIVGRRCRAFRVDPVRSEQSLAEGRSDKFRTIPLGRRSRRWCPTVGPLLITHRARAAGR